MTGASTGEAVGVVLAAGLGSRVGADGNKAYLRLAGRTMVGWSVAAVAGAPGIARTVLVFRRGERDLAEAAMRADLPGVAVEFVEGGDTRHASEDRVLTHLAADVDAGRIDVIVIHDGARPLADPALVGVALDTARRFGGAIPGLPAVDLIGPDGALPPSADATPVRVQTPQAFRAVPLLHAYRRAAAEAFDGTDTSACVQRFTDLDVHVFPGDPANLKVTHPPDLKIAEALLGDRTRGVSPPG